MKLLMCDRQSRPTFFLRFLSLSTKDRKKQNGNSNNVKIITVITTVSYFFHTLYTFFHHSSLHFLFSPGFNNISLWEQRQY